jgi:hypothetical protein
MWWAVTIIAAVLDEDEESREQLAAATGDPAAWEAFAKIGPADEDDWADTIEAFVMDPDHSEVFRAGLEDPTYDPILGRAAELATRLARGIRARRPEALPR